MKPCRLLTLAMAVAAAGCGDPYGMRYCQPDTLPTQAGSTVMTGYDDGRLDLRRGEARQAQELMREIREHRRNDPPPGVTVPPPEPAGTVPSPWTEPPSVILAGLPPATHSSADPEAPHTRTVPAPGEAISAGDDLDVSVERHPEFSGRWRLGTDGRLLIPATGAFGPGLLSPEQFSRRIQPAAGTTPDSLGAAIARELAPYLKTPPEVKVTPGPRRGG